jgi:hypothetical protein
MFLDNEKFHGLHKYIYIHESFLAPFLTQSQTWLFSSLLSIIDSFDLCPLPSHAHMSTNKI